MKNMVKINKKIYFIFAILLVVFCSGFSGNNWITFISHDGKFKVMFPKKAEETLRNVNTGIIPLKSKLVKYDVGKLKDENQSYQLVYSDYDEAFMSSDYKQKIIDSFLRAIVNEVRTELSGKLISVENITYKGYPGKHIHYSFNGGQSVLNVKLWLIKSRVYMLRVECEPGHDDNPSMLKFFTSFELTDDQSTN